jgi:predicted  nucleic acid-binding Zn-ribbon protein
MFCAVCGKSFNGGANEVICSTCLKDKSSQTPSKISNLKTKVKQSLDEKPADINVRISDVSIDVLIKITMFIFIVSLGLAFISFALIEAL